MNCLKAGSLLVMVQPVILLLYVFSFFLWLYDAGSVPANGEKPLWLQCHVTT